MSKWDRLLEVYIDYAEDPRLSQLRMPGISLVRGDGLESAEHARVMVVGEAPGAQENGAGRPFVGASGRVLNQLLNRAGIWWQDCFVTNVVKYRPMLQGRNAPPTLIEQIDSMDYVRREWQIIQPQLTILVGAVAHNMMGKSGLSLSASYRGSLAPYGKKGWVTSQFHPAYGLRSASARAGMEADWDRLHAMLREADAPANAGTGKYNPLLCWLCDGDAAREGTTCTECNPEGNKT